MVSIVSLKLHVSYNPCLGNFTSTYSGSTPVLNVKGESVSRALLCECEYFVDLCFQLYLVEISLPQPLQLPSCLLAWALAGSG